jgi:hypothetical protein
MKTASYLLVELIAQMHYDGEELPNGEEFIMENDDAVMTLSNLIETARSIVAQPLPDSFSEATKKA